MKLLSNIFSSASESACDGATDGLFILPPASSGDPAVGPVPHGLATEDSGLNIVTEDSSKPIITES